MNTWLVTTTQRDAPGYRMLIDGTYEDALNAAVTETIRSMSTSEPDDHPNKIAAAVAAIVKPMPEDSYVELELPEEYGSVPGTDEPNFDYFLLWHHAPASTADDPNIGIGPASRRHPGDTSDGNGTDRLVLGGRSENYWFNIAPWEPDPKRYKELNALPHAELVNHILRLEATH